MKRYTLTTRGNLQQYCSKHIGIRDISDSDCRVFETWVNKFLRRNEPGYREVDPLIQVRRELIRLASRRKSRAALCTPARLIATYPVTYVAQSIGGDMSLSKELEKVFAKKPELNGSIQGARNLKKSAPGMSVYKFPSKKAGATLYVEGNLEHAGVIVLEAASTVKDYRSQPIKTQLDGDDF